MAPVHPRHRFLRRDVVSVGEWIREKMTAPVDGSRRSAPRPRRRKLHRHRRFARRGTGARDARGAQCLGGKIRRCALDARSSASGRRSLGIIRHPICKCPHLGTLRVRSPRIVAGMPFKRGRILKARRLLVQRTARSSGTRPAALFTDLGGLLALLRGNHAWRGTESTFVHHRPPGYTLRRTCLHRSGKRKPREPRGLEVSGFR